VRADPIRFYSMQVLSTDRVEFRVVNGKDFEVGADHEQQVENREGSVQADARSSRGEMTSPLCLSPASL
jgi:hypothetical protein